MPEVPPIGDPQRALHLAIRTMRLLGLVFVSFGLVAVVLAWLAIGRLINTPTVSWLALATAALVFFIPGVLYMVFAMLLARRHSWAAVGGIIVAVVQLLYALWTFAMAMARGSHAGALGLLGLWMAGLIQLIYYLSRAPEALRAEARGFEALPPAMPMGHAPPMSSPPPLPLPGERTRM